MFCTHSAAITTAMAPRPARSSGLARDRIRKRPDIFESQPVCQSHQVLEQDGLLRVDHARTVGTTRGAVSHTAGDDIEQPGSEHGMVALREEEARGLRIER